MLHNGQLVDPLNAITKRIREITGKKKMTDADHQAIAHLEFIGGMYVDAQGHPCIPGDVIMGAVISGAKKMKEGPRAKAGIFCDGNWKIQNGGADLSNVDQLWKSGKYHKTVPVRIGMKKIMRTRPFFNPWSVECEITYDDTMVDEAEVLQWLNQPGVAIGDWRPQFGRFAAEKI